MAFFTSRERAELEKSLGMQANELAPENVIPFAPTKNEVPSSDVDPLDRAGDAILALLERASGVAAEHCKRAMDLAHQLSVQLRSR